MQINSFLVNPLFPLSLIRSRSEVPEEWITSPAIRKHTGCISPTVPVWKLFSTDTKEHAGSIEKTSGVHGIALAPEFSRGFTSNGKSNNVTVFDLKTLAVIGTIDVGKKPDAIMYEPTTKRIFTFNGESENCSAIDAATMKVVGTLALGGGPEAPVADRKGNIFVNIETTNEVVQFDAASLKIISRWPVAPAQTPTGISMRPCEAHSFHRRKKPGFCCNECR